MGRIYNATSRLAADGVRDGAPLPGATGNGKVNKRILRSESQPASQFNFTNYALGMTSREGEGVSTHLEPVMPVREVELNSQRLDPHLVTLSEYDPAAAEQYQRLAGSLITAATERPLKRVLLTSALRGEGRTCVLLNLAGALAQARQRVLVIDTDLRRPSVARLMGLEVEVGLTDLLAEGATSADARCRVLPGRFDVLPTCGQPENAAQLLVSSEFEELLERFDRQYDFVLFDSAPLLEAGDAQLLLRLVDTALVVVAQGRCSASQASRVTAQIAPEDIFGVVLNRRTD